MKNILLTLIAASVLAGPAAASGFNLDSLSLDEVRASAAGFAVPELRAPAAPAEEDDAIGIDATVRIPFKALKKAVTQVAASEKRLTIVDPSAPVISKAGDFLKLSNIRLDINGIIAEPTLTLKPWFEGKDKLALRIQRIQLHASMMPDKSRAAAQPQLSQEDLMEQAMAVMTKGIISALNARFAKQQIPLKAEDILIFKYDKAAWTLHTTISAKFVQSYLPHGLVGDIHLTGFSFDDSGIAVKFGTAN